MSRANQLRKLLQSMSQGQFEEEEVSQEELLKQQKVVNQDRAMSSVESQMKNTSAEITEAGKNPEELTDTRNPLEKMFNLKQDQNFIFDIFELIGRPQQAIFGGISSAMGYGETEGEGFLTGALKGLTGDKVTRGEDILTQAAAGNSNLGTTIGGLAMDVFLDPMDIAFLGAGKISAATGKVGKLLDPAMAASKLETLKDLDNMREATKAAKEFSDAASVSGASAETVKAAKKAKNSFMAKAAHVGEGIAKSDLLKEGSKKATDLLNQLDLTEQRRIYERLGKNFELVKANEKLLAPTDLVMRGMFGAFKNTFVLGDEAINVATKVFGGADYYKSMKDLMKSTFSPTAVVGNLSRAYRKAYGAEGVFAKYAEPKLEIIGGKFEEFATKTGQDVDSLEKQVSIFYTNQKYKPELTISQIFSRGTVHPYSEDVYNKMVSTLSLAEGEKASDFIKVFEYEGNTWIDMVPLISNPQRINKKAAALKAKVGIPTMLKPEELKMIEVLKQNPEFMEFYNDFDLEWTDFMDRASEIMGVDFQNETLGYLRNTITSAFKESEIFEAANKYTQDSKIFQKAGGWIGQPDTFKGKKYLAGATEANRWKNADLINRVMYDVKDSLTKNLTTFTGTSPEISKTIKEIIDTGTGLYTDGVKAALAGAINDNMLDYEKLLSKEISDRLSVEMLNMTAEGLDKIKIYRVMKDGKVVKEAPSLRAVLAPEQYNRFVDIKKSNPELLEKMIGKDQMANIGSKKIAVEPKAPKAAPINKAPVEKPETFRQKLTPEGVAAYEAKDAAKTILKEKHGLTKINDINEQVRNAQAGKISDPELTKDLLAYRKASDDATNLGKAQVPDTFKGAEYEDAGYMSAYPKEAQASADVLKQQRMKLREKHGINQSQLTKDSKGKGFTELGKTQKNSEYYNDVKDYRKLLKSHTKLMKGYEAADPTLLEKAKQLQGGGKVRKVAVEEPTQTVAKETTKAVKRDPKEIWGYETKKGKVRPVTDELIERETKLTNEYWKDVSESAKADLKDVDSKIINQGLNKIKEGKVPEGFKISDLSKDTIKKIDAWKAEYTAVTDLSKNIKEQYKLIEPKLAEDVAKAADSKVAKELTPEQAIAKVDENKVTKEVETKILDTTDEVVEETLSVGNVEAKRSNIEMFQSVLDDAEQLGLDEEQIARLQRVIQAETDELAEIMDIAKSGDTILDDVAEEAMDDLDEIIVSDGTEKALSPLEQSLEDLATSQDASKIARKNKSELSKKINALKPELDTQRKINAYIKKTGVENIESEELRLLVEAYEESKDVKRVAGINLAANKDRVSRDTKGIKPTTQIIADAVANNDIDAKYLRVLKLQQSAGTKLTAINEILADPALYNQLSPEFAQSLAEYAQRGDRTLAWTNTILPQNPAFGNPNMGNAQRLSKIGAEIAEEYNIPVTYTVKDVGFALEPLKMEPVFSPKYTSTKPLEAIEEEIAQTVDQKLETFLRNVEEFGEAYEVDVKRLGELADKQQEIIHSVDKAQLEFWDTNKEAVSSLRKKSQELNEMRKELNNMVVDGVKGKYAISEVHVKGTSKYEPFFEIPYLPKSSPEWAKMSKSEIKARELANKMQETIKDMTDITRRVYNITGEKTAITKLSRIEKLADMEEPLIAATKTPEYIANANQMDALMKDLKDVDELMGTKDPLLALYNSEDYTKLSVLREEVNKKLADQSLKKKFYEQYFGKGKGLPEKSDDLIKLMEDTTRSEVYKKYLKKVEQIKDTSKIPFYEKVIDMNEVGGIKRVSQEMIDELSDEQMFAYQYAKSAALSEHAKAKGLIGRSKNNVKQGIVDGKFDKYLEDLKIKVPAEASIAEDLKLDNRTFNKLKEKVKADLEAPEELKKLISDMDFAEADAKIKRARADFLTPMSKPYEKLTNKQVANMSPADLNKTIDRQIYHRQREFNKLRTAANELEKQLVSEMERYMYRTMDMTDVAQFQYISEKNKEIVTNIRALLRTADLDKINDVDTKLMVTRWRDLQRNMSIIDSEKHLEELNKKFRTAFDNKLTKQNFSKEYRDSRTIQFNRKNSENYFFFDTHAGLDGSRLPTFRKETSGGAKKLVPTMDDFVDDFIYTGNQLTVRTPMLPNGRGAEDFWRIDFDFVNKYNKRQKISMGDAAILAEFDEKKAQEIYNVFEYNSKSTFDEAGVIGIDVNPLTASEKELQKVYNHYFKGTTTNYRGSMHHAYREKWLKLRRRHGHGLSWEAFLNLQETIQDTASSVLARDFTDLQTKLSKIIDEDTTARYVANATAGKTAKVSDKALQLVSDEFGLSDRELYRLKEAFTKDTRAEGVVEGLKDILIRREVQSELTDYIQSFNIGRSDRIYMIPKAERMAVRRFTELTRGLEQGGFQPDELLSTFMSGTPTDILKQGDQGMIFTPKAGGADTLKGTKEIAKDLAEGFSDIARKRLNPRGNILKGENYNPNTVLRKLSNADGKLPELLRSLDNFPAEQKKVLEMAAQLEASRKAEFISADKLDEYVVLDIKNSAQKQFEKMVDEASEGIKVKGKKIREADIPIMEDAMGMSPEERSAFLQDIRMKQSQGINTKPVKKAIPTPTKTAQTTPTPTPTKVATETKPLDVIADVNKKQATTPISQPKQADVTQTVKSEEPFNAIIGDTEKVTDIADDDLMKDISISEIDRKDIFDNIPYKKIRTDEDLVDIQDMMRANGVPESVISSLRKEEINKVLVESQKKIFSELKENVRAAGEFADRFKGLPAFEEGITKSVADWAYEFGRSTRNAKVYQEAFSVMAFGSRIELENPESLIRFIPDEVAELKSQTSGLAQITKKQTVQGKTPSGYVRIDNIQGDKGLIQKMKASNYFLKDKNINNAIKAIEDATKAGGGVLVMESNVARLLTVDYNKSSSKLLEMVDAMNGLFKRNKLLSPAYNLRNMIGITTNMFLSGIDFQDMPKLFAEADEVFKMGPSLMAKKAQRAAQFTAKEMDTLNKYEMFIRGGFTLPVSPQEALARGMKGADGFGSQLQDVSGLSDTTGMLSKAGETPKNLNMIDKASVINSWGNETADAYGRMAVLIKASADPDYMAKIQVSDPIEAVRLSMFDPRDLTPNETGIIKKIVPFYTFTKMNLAYHMKNMPNNAVRYNRMYKGIQGLWSATGTDEETIPQYKLDQMYIPLPAMTKDGKYFAIKANLPQSDLGEFIGNPLERVTSAITPLIRAPFEMATGRTMFGGREIENFRGERSNNIPFIDKKTEHLLSQTGYDVPAKVLGGAGQLITGDVGRGLANMTNIVDVGDTRREAMSAQYSELDKLQDSVKLLKQQGYILPDIRLKKQNEDEKLKNVNFALERLKKMRGV